MQTLRSVHRPAENPALRFRPVANARARAASSARCRRRLAASGVSAALHFAFRGSRRGPSCAGYGDLRATKCRRWVLHLDWEDGEEPPAPRPPSETTRNDERPRSRAGVLSFERRRSESNRRSSFCRALPYHLATAPSCPAASTRPTETPLLPPTALTARVSYRLAAVSNLPTPRPVCKARRPRDPSQAAGRGGVTRPTGRGPTHR